MDDNRNAPAYPCGQDVTMGLWKPETGLTKRERIAAMAMQGLLACGEQHDEHTATVTAKSAVRLADELLKELEKTR